MKTNWIIESIPFKENANKLKKAIVNQNHTYYQVERCQLLGSNEKSLPDLPIDELSIFYGSLNLARIARKKYSGCWCDLEKLKCSTYYSHYGKHLLNTPYCIFPFGDYNNLKPHLFERFGHNGDIFLRPNSGYKIFTGGLIAEQESMNHFLANKLVFPEELIIAAKPANIAREWRLVVCDGRVIASSQYQKNGLLDIEEGCPTDIFSFATEVIQDWTPEICFVIDICQSGDRLFVLELNSFSCSGLYDCNLDEVVYHASLAAEKEYNENL